jgi:uncharacterized protein
LLGFLTGAVIYGMTYQRVFPAISALANLGSVNIPDMWHLSPFLTVLLFAMISLLLFYLIDCAGWQRKVKD